MITPSYGITATERVLPKLALDFTTASLDARVTFTRALDTATVTNSSGYVVPINANLPRFDYNPITLACKGLLIEESRANLLAYSTTFSNANWTKSDSSVATNVIIAPDSATSSFTFSEAATTASHYIGAPSTSSLTSGTSYTTTVYAKAGTVGVIQLAYSSTYFGANAYANYDLTNGVLGTVGSASTATITAVGNSWYRISLTAPATLSGTTGSFIVFCNNSATAARFPSYAGNTNSSIYIWGAQLEAGAFSTSYIPTAGSSLTRNADVATMTGTNFSDWYSAGAGGVVARVLPSTVSNTRPAVQFDDSTANEVIALQGNTTNPELVIVDGGSPQAQIDAGTIAANTAYNLGVAWNTDNCAAAVNGNAAVTDNTATIPTVTQARLGSNGTNYLNGHIQTIRYWPQRIINAEVQAFSK
jgi:hypothetical protein